MRFPISNCQLPIADGRWRARFFPALIAALLIGAMAQAEPGGNWTTNLADALQSARAQNKPVLLDFSASWCGPCRQMARTTLQEEAVLRALQRWVCVAVDIDAQPKLAQERNISAVPTFVALDPAGDELLRASGYMDADRFRAWLAQANSQFTAGQERKAKFQVEQKQLAADLAGPDAAKRRGAVKQLFDLCSRSEQTEQTFAVKSITEIARREPALLLDGLNHPSLATRIHVANALRAALGEAFHFDPWEKPEARTLAVSQLRNRLDRGGLEER